jgi:hypothetical protein
MGNQTPAKRDEDLSYVRYCVNRLTCSLDELRGRSSGRQTHPRRVSLYINQEMRVIPVIARVLLQKYHTLGSPDGVTGNRLSTQNDYKEEGVCQRRHRKEPEASATTFGQFDHKAVHDYSSGDKPCDPG